jgi:hypothetical protein
VRIFSIIRGAAHPSRVVIQQCYLQHWLPCAVRVCSLWYLREIRVRQGANRSGSLLRCIRMFILGGCDQCAGRVGGFQQHRPGDGGRKRAAKARTGRSRCGCAVRFSGQYLYYAQWYIHGCSARDRDSGADVVCQPGLIGNIDRTEEILGESAGAYTGSYPECILDFCSTKPGRWLWYFRCGCGRAISFRRIVETAV